MKLFILFGQPKCGYDGHYGPEALEVMDEYSSEDNPEWMKEQLEKMKASKGFSSLRVICVEVSDKQIVELLSQEPPEIRGKIAGAEN